MLKKISLILSIILTASALGSNAAAQTVDEETIAVRSSKLAAISLPAGARKMNDNSIPGEIKDTLGKLVAAGGDIVRQGNTEIVIWEGNYKKTAGGQMIKNLENALKTSGWEYEIGEKNNEFVVFSLFRPTPERRALVGFFVPSEDVFVFALTEMLAAKTADGATKAQTQVEVEQPAAKSNSNGSANSILVGKWWRGNGGGFIDYTGKTQYKSGESFYFEFFADGSVEYTRELDVLSIVQCRTKASDKARGKYTVNGESLTINLGAMTSIGSSTCEKSDNYNKTLPASSVSKKFTLKRMESLARPDNPWMLCFEGQEGNACFEKNGR